LEAGARREGALQPHAEPAAKLLRAGERAPDPGSRCAQDDLLLDAVRAHVQPPGCIFTRPPRKATILLHVYRKISVTGLPTTPSRGGRPSAVSAVAAVSMVEIRPR